MIKKKIKPTAYDRQVLKPVIRSSICTGEKVAGFKNLHTNKFTEIMLIRDNRDMEDFMAQYGITPNELSTEW